MIYEKNATEMATALEKGEISAVELTKAHLDRIAAVDGEVKAFLYVDNEGALAQARDVDQRRKSTTPIASYPIHSHPQVLQPRLVLFQMKHCSREHVVLDLYKWRD